MKVTVLQENLARGLSIVSRAVSSRSTLPVLNNVLIATDEGQLGIGDQPKSSCWIGAKVLEGSTTFQHALSQTWWHSTSRSRWLNVRAQTLNLHSGAQHRHQMHRCTGIPSHAGYGFFAGLAGKCHRH
jgi:DNA polymerase-3 subunit beta